MIPKEIQALFDFIDYLDTNKSEYIEYIPICNELRKLINQKIVLNPDKKYKDKLQEDAIQIQISEKSKLINEKIYIPTTSKLQELGIWAKNKEYTSIWNSTPAISKFVQTLTKEDVITIKQYKQKYINFRSETNTDFIFLAEIIRDLDKTLKILFDFFNDTDKNEFEAFETKIIKVNNIEETVKNRPENREKNVEFSIPISTILSNHNKMQEKTITTNSKTEIHIGDKIQVGNISNNSGQFSVGKENKTIVNEKDEIAKKSFFWQKWGTITGFFISIFK